MWPAVDPVTNLNVGDVLVFANIVHNGGGHYDATTGIFKCPITGIYLFSMSVLDLNYEAGDIQVGIYKEDVQLAAASTARSSSSSANNDHESAHALSLSHCNRDEHVMVKVKYIEPTSKGLYAQLRSDTFFTGTLMYGSSSSKQQVRHFFEGPSNSPPHPKKRK